LSDSILNLSEHFTLRYLEAKVKQNLRKICRFF
jgi:hypothetical protein